MQIMKRFVQSIATIAVLLVMGASFWFVLAQSFGSEVPAEYYPDWKISDDYEQMKWAFATLDATIKLSEEPDTRLFSQLLDNFEAVFPYFPKQAHHQQTYTQCEIITAKLAEEYSSQDYAKFKNKCFEDIRWLVKEINTWFTVKASIKAKPVSGALPLTVTFDARESSDPSDDTIPSDNFYWYYKDISGVEVALDKKGPVVNHTFTEPGKYVVHLTARSSNNLEEGILDWADSIEVEVAPKAADIVIYLNWRKMTQDTSLKINSQEAKNWFIIDGSATLPQGERKILQHTWKIRSKQTQERVDILRENDWPPGQFWLSFPYNGTYTVSLEIVDNEGNKIREEYEVSVSDPVALLKYTPKKWDTTQSFTFDGSASYSISSRVAKYQWTIIDPNWNQVENFEGKSFSKTFNLPWVYTIQLKVEDEFWSESFDIHKVEVDSAEPIPSFQILPLSNREKPSQFVLDASWTFDSDVWFWVDELSYSWSFSNPWVVDINKTEPWWEKIVITYNETWTHKIKLTVRDSYWKTADVEKNVVVDSTLRPEMFPSPLTATWWEEITFATKSNKPVSRYNRDFWDWASTSSVTWASVKHVYNKAWVFPVTIAVATADGEENSVTRNVFMWQKDTPVLAYEVRYWADQYLTKETTCEVEGETMPAYRITRDQQFQFSLQDSINAKGEKQGLWYFITHGVNDEWKVFEKSSISTDFDELGCTYLEVAVQDKSTAKETREKIYFLVENDLPVIGNVTISFPQAKSNDSASSLNIWAWLQVSQSQQETFDLVTRDPLLVRVSVTWQRDNDSQIKRFIWYYYDTKDPDERQYTAITPANVPYYTFTVHRVAGEFAFWVIVEDTDWGKVDSHETLWVGPSITFSSPGKIDLPLVDLDVNTTDITVGEEIVFTMNSEVISNRTDFEEKRYYKIDFDWDGVFESEPIKNDEYRYVYDQVGEYNPQVKVKYRDKVWVDKWPTIIVRQGVKNQLFIDAFGNKALVKNTSIGNFDVQKLCLNVPDCNPESEFAYNRTWAEILLVDYPDNDTYQISLAWIDELWNRPTTYTTSITTTTDDDPFRLLSFPKPTVHAVSGVALTVWSQLDNTITFAPIFNEKGSCFIDLNLSEDSDNDDDPLFDHDIECNETVTMSFDTLKSVQRGNIYFVRDNVLTEIPLTITFLDNISSEDIEIPEEMKDIYNRIEDLISDVENGVAPNDSYYLLLLDNLRRSLVDEDDTDSIILQLHEYITTSRLALPDDHRDKLDVLLLTLTDETLQAAIWGTEYDKAKANILAWFSGKQRESMHKLFQSLESSLWDQDAIKKQIDALWKASLDQYNDGVLDEVDFNNIVLNLCSISRYYEVPTKTCGDEEISWSGTVKQENNDTSNNSLNSGDDSSWWFFSGIMKRVIIAVVALILIFIIIVVIFAIKAKSNAWDLDEDDE